MCFTQKLMERIAKHIILLTATLLPYFVAANMQSVFTLHKLCIKIDTGSKRTLGGLTSCILIYIFILISYF